MQPHDRALNIWQSEMEATALRKVDGCHAHTAPALISTIVGLDCHPPELAHLIRALVEPNINKRITESQVGLKIRRRLTAAPLVDKARHDRWSIPAPQLAT